MEDETQTVSQDAGAPRPIAYIRPLTEAERANNPEGLHAARYALHDEDGRPLALFPDRQIAAAIARSNALEPVSVH